MNADETVADSGGTGDEAYCAQCGRSFAATIAQCPHDGTRLVHLAAERDTLLGRVLDGRYEIKAPLGSGGMGTVYRGVQLSVDREVAIKVIHPKLASDRNAVKRFLREARLASRLNQPSIVNVYDFGQSEGVLFLVTELLRGQTLASQLGQGRRLTIRRAAVIGVQLCDALEAAHAQDIVHRDLKPGNIVILDDPPGRDLVKVLDFGLAKSLVGESGEGSNVTTNHAILGTPLYMAPEQIEGKPSDQRADLYALGCILYELVSGAPPYIDSAVSVVLARHLGDTPAALPSHVPGRYSRLVMSLLAKDPAARVQTAGEVRALLQAVLEATPAHGVALAEPSNASDTVPDVSAALAETAAAHSLPIAPAFAAQSQAVSDSLVPRPTSRKGLVVAVVLVLVAGAAAAVSFVTRGGAAVAPPDAGAVRAADAATASGVTGPRDAAVPDAVTLDAAVVPADAPADAARPVPRDAGATQIHHVTHPPPPPPPPPHQAPDAGVNLDFYHRKPS